MTIKKSYKYIKDGVVYVGKEVPEGAEMIEVMDILCAERGMTLIRIADEEDVGSSVWLKDGDKQENYREEERKR